MAKKYSGRKLERDELKGKMPHWYPGIEDDINAGRVNSKESLIKSFEAHKKQFEEKTKEPHAVAKAFRDMFSNGPSLEQFLQSSNAQSAMDNPSFIQSIGNKLQELRQSPVGQQVSKRVGEFVHGKPAELQQYAPLLTPEQLAYQSQILQYVQQSLPEFMKQLRQPIEMPQQPQLGQNVNAALGSLTGPALMTLLSRPNPNMFTGQFASQLPYMQGPSSGIGALLGTLGAPLLQQLLSR